MHSTDPSETAGNKAGHRRTLPIRLRGRAGGFKGAGCFVGTIFLFMAGVMFLGGEDNGENLVSSGFVANGFAVVAGLLFLAEVLQWLAAKTPRTIVEIERSPIHPGESVRVCVRQPGSVSLYSLRANLICLDCSEPSLKWDPSGRHGPKQPTERQRLVYSENFLDVRGLKIDSGDFWEQVVDLVVPPDAPPSARKRVVWRIELWGKVHFWLNFMHSFEIDVAPTTSEDFDPAIT